MESVVPGVAEVVVGDQAQVLDPFAGHAHDVEDRKPVCLGAHHTVECGQFTDAVGGGQDRRTAGSGVAVGRVGGVQFVGARHPVQAVDLLDGVVDGKRVVPGYSKDLVDAEGGEASQGVLRNCGIRHAQ